MPAAAIIALLESLIPAIANDLISNEKVQHYIAAAIAIIKSGFAVDEKVKALSDHIRQMVAENRDPTAEEWDALLARSDVAHEAIQAWKPDAPEEPT